MDNKNISAEISWVDRVFKRYKETGRLIPERQEKLYRAINKEFCGGKTILDMGCSLGVGSNILAYEARFVWGLDINEEAIDFAQKTFRRPNLDFEILDIENPPAKELAQFEIVVMSEILEHIELPEVALQNLKRFMVPSAISFITCPNEANEEVRINATKHGFHLSHWNAGQFYELLTKHFGSVVMFDVDKLDTWNQPETVDGNSTAYLIVAKCENPI